MRKPVKSLEQTILELHKRYKHAPSPLSENYNRMNANVNMVPQQTTPRLGSSKSIAVWVQTTETLQGILMQVKETTKYASIILDKEEDFSKQNMEGVLKKIEEYKKLPFHDVILQIDSKHYMKFWEILISKKLKYKEAEIKNNIFSIKF